MDPKQKLDERLDGVKLDCSKCPIPEQDCLGILEIVKMGGGSYSVREQDCLLKLLLRDTTKYFHF